MKWQLNLPDSEGDWLWLNLWSCACCVRGGGIAEVHVLEPDDKPFKGPESFVHNGFEILFRGKGNLPLKDTFGNPIVDMWAKIELPDKEWYDQVFNSVEWAGCLTEGNNEMDLIP